MTTDRLTRHWHLPAAGLIAVVLAGITLQSHWGAFIQWCLATQITLHRYLVMVVLAQSVVVRMKSCSALFVN